MNNVNNNSNNTNEIDNINNNTNNIDNTNDTNDNTNDINNNTNNIDNTNDNNINDNINNIDNNDICHTYDNDDIVNIGDICNMLTNKSGNMITNKNKIVNSNNINNKIKILLDMSLKIYITHNNKLYNIDTKKKECYFEIYNDFLLITWINTKIIVFYIKDNNNIYKNYDFKNFDMCFYKKQIKNSELSNLEESIKHWIINSYLNNIPYYDKAYIIIDNKKYKIYVNHLNNRIWVINRNKYYKIKINKNDENIIKINLNYFTIKNDKIYFNNNNHIFKKFIRINNIYYDINKKVVENKQCAFYKYLL